jgi:hypothetical protein
MRDFHVSPIVLGLSLLSTATLSHAAWFYDADSCGSKCLDLYGLS